MNVIKINQILTVNNFPKYRLSQVLDGIFKQFVSSWGEITNLPKDLIEILEKETPISSLEIAQDFEALPKDASKILFKAKDGNSVETVLMKHADKGESGGGRKTVCISSQAGCLRFLRHRARRIFQESDCRRDAGSGFALLPHFKKTRRKGE